MPQNGLNMFRPDQLGSPQSGEKPSQAANARHLVRHSVELNMLFGEPNHESITSAPSNNRPVSLQSSYSTNDLPTVKANGFGTAITPPKTHAEQFHQHNASLGRIPANAMNGRSAKESPEREEPRSLNGHVPQSGLQASAAPFGPQMTSAASTAPLASQAPPNGLPNFQNPIYNYNLQAYMNNSAQVNGGQLPNYNAHSQFPGYAPYNSNNNFRFPESPARNGSTRRNVEADPSQLSRFSNLPLEHYQGELYSLCKDQHGCRYLQRKLEERNSEHVQIIFNETHMHVVELMTGWSLCISLCVRSAFANSHAKILLEITSARNCWNSRMMSSVPCSSTTRLLNWSKLL
jgi:hypothetical protein